MPISEAARADLYTGLAEVLGPDRAEILMAQLPRFDPAEVATRTDLADLRGELRDGLAAVSQRLDRLFLTLLIGMFGVAAALISLVFSVS